MSRNKGEEVRESAQFTKVESAFDRMPRLRFPEYLNALGWNRKNGDELFTAIADKDHNSDLPILAISQEFGAIPRDMIDYQVSATEKSIESYKVVNVGDFIISLRSFQGGIEYSKYKGICSPAYIVLRRKKKSVQNLFFKYYFKTDKFIAELNKNIEGIRDGKMVSYAQFSELLLPLPSPEEQQKIAACLSSIDELIATHIQKLEALKKYKKGLMQQLFPVEGEKVPWLRFPEFRGTGEWARSKIDDIAIRGSGHTPNKSKPEYYNGRIKWVSLADSSKLDNGYIYETKIEISNMGIKNSSAVLHPANTVILSRDAGVGKSAILFTPMAVSQHFIVWICDKDKLLNWFLYFWLQVMKPVFENIANGSTIKTIGLLFFKELCIAIPSLPEQQKIASCLSSLNDLIFTQSVKIEELKEHKRGLMQGLFPNPVEAP
jgi:type I restriction enzyme S subunit